MTFFDRAVNVARVIENEPRTKNRNDYWKGSKLNEIRKMAPATKGRFGEQVAQEYLLAAGYDITKSKNRESDFCISMYEHPPIPIEVKTSFLWADDKNPQYKFEQIRLDYDYKILLCLAFSYDNVKLYTFAKNGNFSINRLLSEGILVKQHGNSNYWFSIYENSNAEWHQDGYIPTAINFVAMFYRQFVFSSK